MIQFSLYSLSNPIAFHVATLGLGLTWWFEGDATNATIAAIGALLTILAHAFLRKDFVWWLAIAVFAHLAFGIRLELYVTNKFYDELVHFLAIGSLVVIAVRRLQADSNLMRTLSPRTALFVCTSVLALAFGAAWELIEFSIDSVFSLCAQQSLRDTNLDLLADLFGGIGAFAVLQRSAFTRHSLRIVLGPYTQ